jgi:hypothetical protein
VKAVIPSSASVAFPTLPIASMLLCRTCPCHPSLVAPGGLTWLLVGLMAAGQDLQGACYRHGGAALLADGAV